MKCGGACCTTVVIFVSILATFLFPCVSGAETCAEWVGKVISVQGDVQALRDGDTQWRTASLNDTFCPGDTVRVQERSRADIMLANDAIFRLDQKTIITFSGPDREKTFLINLRNGIAHFFSRFRRSLKVSTPFVNATVEGTEFLVKVENDRTFMSVFEGKVDFANEKGSILLASGQSAVAAAGQAPAIQVVARPRDAVQWTLYYPPVFPVRPVEYQTGADWKTRVSYLLSVGRVDEAGAEIEEALKASPGNSDALAVQSVIALVQNDKDKAYALAKKAVEANPDSASARIALSYALQSRFDLKGALESLKEAVKREPDNALAWARLSEIWLSFGSLDESLEAAKKAAILSPESARAQTVLGFAHLMRVETRPAKDAFEKAITLDQADPLPRLGLGLATIREGKLAEGRKEIEIAESLDPDNSLIRSYLGKAYYEEKRDEKSSEQFAKAKEFDPLDPTSWFYDAIRKQSINRPVEALHDLQKSMELNDNRAIYRSELLLDQDLAARSASLARIFSDLGFQQLALVEGWQSVNADPANYSAHRFLSDSYSALPRHEIARVSELLQSQLLQPLNITPVQPELAESNLFILNGAGPSALSFNEFNPLFNRNRISLQAGGVMGGNSTFGDELIASGVYDKFSFSLGQFHYETDGFRANNDLKTDIYNIFAQYSLSPQTSVQAEYRHKDLDEGDLSLRFSPEIFSSDFREKDKTDSVRFGIHHSLSTNSDILVSAIYQDQDINQPGIATIDATGYGVEAQHLHRTGRLKLITGVGYFNTEQQETSEFLPPGKTNTDHTNLYLYSYINYPEQLTWTFGASGDFFNSDFLNLNRNQFNPKFGLTWNLFPKTTIRAAVFRTLKRTLLNDQTLEPTQVAGFNQFFDDFIATDAWRYGIGLDQKFTKELFAGAEFSKRDLKVPGQIFDPVTGAVTSADFDLHELLGRAYVNWAPHPWLALTAEYQYEKFKRPEDFVSAEDLISRLETQRLSLGINFFHPTGLFAKLKPSYVYQHGDFFGPPTPPEMTLSINPGSDHFWVFDASVGYRFPKRYGIFTIEARNLFNEKFNFQDTDPANPSISPKRLILAKFTLSF